MSKGISQTDGVQVVGRAELAFGKTYLGALAKNLDSPSAEGELQISAGGRFKLHRAEVAASIAYKKWLDTGGSPDGEAAEMIVSISQTLGKLVPRAQLIYSPDDLGSTTYSIYAEAGLGWKPVSRLTLSANLGRRQRGNGVNYTSANAGASYAVGKALTAELRLYDTNKSDVDEPFRRRVVAALRAKF